ncbi:protein krueppel-like isoform X4 [Dreissena polymorpha]|uniref:protein krueppel-like isoform X4 n=1 Tax=Dreissena polymorpha TaxID=45954 RepID=UPI002264E6FD|nr:protein krueppel-like isoform X4 [Dreissena polymorpha]
MGMAFDTSGLGDTTTNLSADQSFKTPDSMMVRSPEGMYQCLLCGRQNRHKADLKKHLRVHTGERPFKCQVCQRMFRQIQHLKRHEISAHISHTVME